MALEPQCHASASKAGKGDMGIKHKDGADSKPVYRGSRGGKRFAYPFINSEVIAIAETGDLNLLLSTIERHISQMNLVNLATSLHRVAKIVAHDTQSQRLVRNHEVVTVLLQTLVTQLGRFEKSGTTPHCQALSNIMWSLATVQIVDMAVLEISARLSLRSLQSFKPFEWSSMLWAYAKLDGMDHTAGRYGAPIFQAAVAHILSGLSNFSFRCLVMIVWAFASAGHHVTELFEAIAEHMPGMLNSALPQELSNVVWAFSTAGFRIDSLLTDVAKRGLRQVEDFKSHELSSILWGFASVGFFHDAFYTRAAFAVRNMDLEPEQMSNIVWAMTRIRPKHNAAHVSLLALLPQCTRKIDGFKTHELAAVALAASKCFCQTGPELRAEGQQEDKSTDLPIQVREFFNVAWDWILPRLESLTGQSLASITSAFVTVNLGLKNTELVTAISREVVRRLDSLESSPLLLLLRRLSGLAGFGSDEAVRALFGEAGRRVDKLRTKDIQVLSRTVVDVLGLRHRTDPVTQEWLQNICQTISSVGLTAMTSQASPKETVDMEDTNLSESSRTKIRSSDTKSIVDSGLDLGEAERRRLHTPMSYSIKNTFLHIDVTGDATSDNVAEQQLAAALSPSLGIIPPSVSGEKLDAFRVAYQSFRAGYASGAKGELSTCNTGDSFGAQVPSNLDALLLEARAPPGLSRQVEFGKAAVPTDVADDAGARNARRDGSSVSSESSPTRWRLPPPLPQLPQIINLSELESYRIDYQRFRAGESVGAKGEVSRVSMQKTGSEAMTGPVRELSPRLSIIPESVSTDELNMFRSEYQNFRGGNACGARGEISGIPAVCSGPRVTERPPSNSFSKSDWSSEQSFATPATDAKGRVKSHKDLPPLLDIMPRFIDLEKLECYRRDYQSFRIGGSVGAKGEMFDAEEDTSTTVVAVGPTGHKLPPPLDILPPSLSQEQLATYRTSYQRFRAGMASGAKGEVSTIATMSD